MKVRLTFFPIVLAGLIFSTAAAFAETADRQFEKLRQQAIHRPRRIIFNNDGNEPVVFCKEVSRKEFLSLRTTPLVGSQVDSIFYCTWSSGFSVFSHNTKIGQVMSTREAMFSNNLAPAFLAKGLDPLQMMTEFAHENKKEIFWSFRMNDTHDGSSATYGPVMFRANKLKNEHPEYLIASKDKPSKFGAWSAVDYGRPEIRKLAFQFCEEVCQNYDVDGIELDFFRHLLFFKCSSRGEPCGETELNQMTELIRQIRAMMEAEGHKRGRPILLAVRVPDSLEYAKVVGLDLERWLSEGLIDLLIPSGYTQLNPWEYSVALGKKYKVKVYPSLDESRVRAESARQLRETIEAYRGRAMNVWSAGADGVYLFNFFDATNPMLREIGDPKVLRQLDRTYFASVRGVGAVPVPHQSFIRVPVLNPANPVALEPNKPTPVEFRIDEDLQRVPRGQAIFFRLQFKGLNEMTNVAGKINGGLFTDVSPLTLPSPQRGEGESKPGEALWLEWKLPGKFFRKNVNTLELRNGSDRKASLLDLSVVVKNRN